MPHGDHQKMNRSIASSDITGLVSSDHTKQRMFTELVLQIRNICNSRYRFDDLMKKRKPRSTPVKAVVKTPTKDNFDPDSISPIAGSIGADQASFNGSPDHFHSTFDYPMNSTLVFDEEPSGNASPSGLPEEENGSVSSLEGSSGPKNFVESLSNRRKILSNLPEEGGTGLKNLSDIKAPPMPLDRSKSDRTLGGQPSVLGLAPAKTIQRRKRIRKDFHRFIGQYVHSARRGMSGVLFGASVRCHEF